MKTKIVFMKQITKEFSGVRVLDRVDFNVYQGRIMALVGENGAGKSTLMKIMTGVYTKTEGEILLSDQPVQFNNTRESQDHGIAIIHQELNLVRDLSVAENIFLGREPLNRFHGIHWSKLYRDAQYWLNKLGLQEDARELIKNISVGRQQLVEIAKALSLQAKVIIMDEPTGALTLSETKKLFSVIRELKDEGVSIVYISHRLNEIFEICDDVTVLRDGHLIGEKPISEVNEDQIIEMMVGRKLTEQYPRLEKVPGEIVLEVQHLTNRFVRDISFELRQGEILGVAGLMGSGRTEMARTIYGVYPHDKGEIRLEGRAVHLSHPLDALNAGIAYVSEDRKTNGILLGLNVRENITLSSLKSFCRTGGPIHQQKEEETATRYMGTMSIKAAGTKQLLRYLSGGNQQKVSIAKSLNTNPKVLILDEPTRGVDVGAKKEIYELINGFKEQGMSILMISSEISEILGMSDRILVMHEGELTGTLSREEANQESIMSLAVGKDVS